MVIWRRLRMIANALKTDTEPPLRRANGWSWYTGSSTAAGRTPGHGHLQAPDQSAENTSDQHRWSQGSVQCAKWLGVGHPNRIMLKTSPTSSDPLHAHNRKTFSSCFLLGERYYLNDSKLITQKQGSKSDGLVKSLNLLQRHKVTKKQINISSLSS